MTNEDKQIHAKLKQLEKAAFRNELLMHKAFIKYENLVAEGEALASSIEALRAFREKQRRQLFGAKLGTIAVGGGYAVMMNDE